MGNDRLYEDGEAFTPGSRPLYRRHQDASALGGARLYGDAGANASGECMLSGVAAAVRLPLTVARFGRGHGVRPLWEAVRSCGSVAVRPLFRLCSFRCPLGVTDLSTRS